MVRKKGTRARPSIILLILVAIFLLIITWYHLISSNIGSKSQYVLSVKYGSKIITYDMDKLENLPIVSGYGGILKGDNSTEGPYTYRGIPIKYFITNFNISGNYSITVKCRNGHTRTFPKDIVNGKVKTYDESGNYLGLRKLTMVIAYEKEGSPLGKNEGPLEIAFVSDEGVYFTESDLWLQQVDTVIIND